MNGLLPFLTDCISSPEAKLGSVRIRVDRTGFISLRLSCYKGGTHHAHVVCDSHMCVCFFQVYPSCFCVSPMSWHSKPGAAA